jgi:hypothetical protein
LNPSRSSERKSTPFTIIAKSAVRVVNTALDELALFVLRQSSWIIRRNRLITGMMIMKIMLIEPRATLMGIIVQGPVWLLEAYLCEHLASGCADT